MRRAARTERILVLGLGNPLMGDDGFGAAVAAALGERDLPPEVEVMAAPDVLCLDTLWRGQSEVWLVDAVRGGSAPGTVHLLEHDSVLGLPARPGSAHHVDLSTALQWLILADPRLGGVRFRLWGCEPERLRPPSGLTRSVVGAVRTTADDIVREVTDRMESGGAAEPRTASTSVSAGTSAGRSQKHPATQSR